MRNAAGFSDTKIKEPNDDYIGKWVAMYPGSGSHLHAGKVSDVEQGYIFILNPYLSQSNVDGEGKAILGLTEERSEVPKTIDTIIEVIPSKEEFMAFIEAKNKEKKTKILS